ncbi:hypothetical protein ACFVDI_07405 [Nocardioides sp. NPDC057767]|uniref:hypothetical protein n=1 Tax=unclassified Nocardioides TaxID=2615069 RepID=UPI0036726755
MLDTSNELLESIGHVALDSAPADWQSITIAMSGMANSTTVRAEVSTPQGSQNLSLGAAGARNAHKLRKSMYTHGAGTWYRATMTIDAQRRLQADFDYYGKPYDESEEGKDFIRDLLLQDHAKYPRTPDLLPEWHPSKQVA